MLTKEEFVEAFQRVAALPIDAVVLEQIAAEIDTNGDGLIAIDELFRFCRARFLQHVQAVTATIGEQGQLVVQARQQSL